MDIKPRPRALLVVGMHRSGTSALTRVMSLLGAALPADLHAYDSSAVGETNELGFFEGKRVIQLNEEFMRQVGSEWNDTAPIPDAAFRSDAAAVMSARILAFLREEFTGTPLFVLKDPRISRTAPLWLDALKAFDAEANFILAQRHPLEVADSLLKRNGMGRGHATLLWLRHTLDAERHTRNYRRSFVAYEDLLADWRKAVRKIAKDCGFEWPRFNVQAQRQVDWFLSGDRRHNVAARSDVEQLPVWTREAYQIVLEALADNVFDADKADEIGAQLDRAESVFRTYIHELDDSAREHAGLNAAAQVQLDEHKTRIELREHSLLEEQGVTEKTAERVKALDFSLREASAQLEALQRTLDETAMQRTALEEALAEAARERAITDSSLAEAKAELEHKQELEQALEEVRVQLAAANDKLLPLEAKLANEGSAREAATKSFEDALRALEELQSQQTRVDNGLKAALTELAGEQERSRRIDEALKASATRSETLQGELLAANTAATRLRKDLRKVREEVEANAEEVERYRVGNAELGSLLTAANRTANEVLEANLALSDAKASQAARSNALSVELSEVAAALATARAEAKDGREQVTQINEALGEARDALIQAHLELQSKQRDLLLLREAQDNQRELYVAAEHRISTLSNDGDRLAIILRSKSWTLTKPLRVAVRSVSILAGRLGGAKS